MVKFNSAWLLRKKQFRSLTGVEPGQYSRMLEKLRPGWKRRVRRKNRDGRPWGVGGLEDHLLVLLILYRCHITQDFLAVLYGVDKATICRSLRRIEKLARRMLGVKKRIVVTAEEAQQLILDCTEQPVQRPARKQRCWYSGKKKRHTIKNEIIVTHANAAKKCRIVAVSDDAPGRVHDVTVRRRGPPLPQDAKAMADSGYQGYQHGHPAIELPHKKTKKNPLTRKQRKHNRSLSSRRVRVEHTIARLKSFRILADRYRYSRAGHIVKLSIVAGIVNLAAGF